LCAKKKKPNKNKDFIQVLISFSRGLEVTKGDSLWAEEGAWIWVSAEEAQQSPHDLPRD